MTVWNWCQKHISKTLEQGYVSHCVVSPLLFITFSPLGTTETNCSCEWHFPPRCAWYANRFKYQSQFHDKNVFSDWQHWTPGRPVQHPDSYWVCGCKGLAGKHGSEPKTCICCLVLMVSERSKNCAHSQWLLEVFLSPWVDFHHISFSCLMQMSKSPIINNQSVLTFGFFPLCAKISHHSLNCLIVLCTTENENQKLFLTLCWGLFPSLLLPQGSHF